MHTLGIDLGTSGVRAIVLELDGRQQAGSVAIAPSGRRDPATLWEAVATVLGGMDLAEVGAIAVAGTSGTLLATDRHGAARGNLSLYGDQADPRTVARLDQVAPAASPARGHTSPLARAIGRASAGSTGLILHEADWIAGLLSGRFGVTDENNALKTGYDPVTREWPDWMMHIGLHPGMLPLVLQPGQPIATITSVMARRFATPANAIIAAGTTDGCASFLSTGACKPGDAVTVLGSTLTLKMLSAVQVSNPAYGIYSHRLWDSWLTGGASNSGGAVLVHFFSREQIEALSARIDPERDSNLHYYPLLVPGERFPVNDPMQQPRLTPRPIDDALFLQGMMEGIAGIEALGYHRLQACGGPPVRNIATVGGGAGNPAWSAIRRRIMSVPIVQARDASAAHGAALVARRALGMLPQGTAGSIVSSA